ncbi:MAG TPA: hypothetical protein VIS48_05170 [Candidatus Kryptonia bacterium]
MLKRIFLFLIYCSAFSAAPVVLAQVAARSSANIASGGTVPQEGESYTVVVSDSILNVPIQLALVALRRDGTIIQEKVTSQSGVAVFVDIDDGTYNLSVHSVGYNDVSKSVVIDKNHLVDSVALTTLTFNEQVVVGQHITPVTTFGLTTGNQVFESETYHAPPTAHMTELIQENLMGVARAPTGEVHIRGMHGEFTYYIDGIPVPLGVFGGLNDVVDPKVIDRATFIDGGWTAEYGGQTAAIIDLQNRVPPGGFHLDASTYAGSYFAPNSNDTLGKKVGSFKALSSNGQNLSLSDHIGNLGLFLSGTRQESDRRIDPPVADIFHDHGFDYFLYGKLDYALSDVDYLTSNLNYSNTYTQVPYDSVEGIMNDLQNTSNGFQTLSYYHVISSETDRESNLFVGGYAREGGLSYTPGPGDPATFQFAGDTTNNYILAEDRSFTTVGTRVKFDSRLSHHFMYAIGLNFSATHGKEDFTSKDSAGHVGPAVMTNFNGSDFGIFAESEIHPLEWTRIELGVRYDQHIAPDAPLQNQVSPRIKWNILFDESNTAYLYYGRLFIPTNVEGLRTIASNVINTGQPTLPERDDFYEVGYIHDFGFGLRSKLDGFYKYSTPGIDDETVGSSAIKTPVNIAVTHTPGIELGFSYNDPSTPFSGYINTSIIHAYGSGAVTGGFLPISDDGTATDLDHDQRLSVVASINYQPINWYVNLTGIYGSGLTNGNPNGIEYKTGLFDFNPATHTAPSWIFDVSGGYTLSLGDGSTLVPSLYITNILDHIHLIKGAYFSAASYEEPRNIVFKIAYHL